MNQAIASQNRMIARRERSLPFVHPSLVLEQTHEPSNLRYTPGETMGSLLSDAIGVNVDVTAGIEHFLSQIRNVFDGISNNLVNIDWNKVSDNLSVLGRATGNLLYEMNPNHILYTNLKANPITGHSFEELDKYTGGTFTSAEKLSSLPYRVVRGDAISKQELVENAIFALKVAMVVASGGSAVALVGFASSQLKQGPLGQTETGRAILTIGEIAGLTALGTGSIAKETGKAAFKMGVGEGQKELVKSSDLGKTEAGQILIGAGGAAATGAVVGGGATEGLTEFAKGTAITKAGRAVPGGDILARHVIEKGVSIDGGAPSTGGSGGSDDSDWSIGDIMINLDLASIPGKIADAISNISVEMPHVSIDMPDISIGTPSISAPDISAPSVKVEWKDVAQIIKFLIGGQQRQAVRQRYIVREDGTPVWEYELDNGEIIQVPQKKQLANVGWILLIGVAGLVFLSRRKS